MAKTAMANLGGQATRKELIAEMLRLPESSSLSSAVVGSFADGYNRKPIMLWQESVSSMLGRWFENMDPPSTRGPAYRVRPATA